jgi:hypothetical protein
LAKPHLGKNLGPHLGKNLGKHAVSKVNSILQLGYNIILESQFVPEFRKNILSLFKFNIAPHPIVEMV